MSSTVKMTLSEAGQFVDTCMDMMKAKGRRFRSYARESLVTSIELGIDKKKLCALFDAYMVPEGIKMPWGKWVKP